MTVTDEHVHDSKAVSELVNDIIKSNKNITVGKAFADGAYDSNNIFRCLSDNGIIPCIKVRKNAKVDGERETFLGIYLLYRKRTIYKNGRTALAMDKDGL